MGSFVDVPPGVPSPGGISVPGLSVGPVSGGGSAGSVHSASGKLKDDVVTTALSYSFVVNKHSFQQYSQTLKNIFTMPEPSILNQY